MSEMQQNLKQSFGSIASLYDEVRPSYPQEVITLISDEVARKKPLRKKPLKMFEIGTGTGQATELFAAQGHTITATDLRQELISVAQRRLAQYTTVTYTVGSFETLELPTEQFDVVFSAQAFHWVDQTIGLPKAQSLLKPGGKLALFWNFINYEGNDQVRAIRTAFTTYAPPFAAWPDASEEAFHSFAVRWFQHISTSGYFIHTKQTVVTSLLEYSKERFLKLVETFSWFQTLETTKQSRLRVQLEELIVVSTSTVALPVRTLVIIGTKAAG